MAFLTLAGIPIPVSAESGGEIDVVNVGEYGRAFSGVPFSSVRARGAEYKGKWPLRPRNESTAYRMLLLGQGESFRFNRTGMELYSTKGLGLGEAFGTATPHASGGPASGPRLSLAADALVGWDVAGSPLLLGALSFWLKSASTSNAWRHFLLEASPGSIDVAWVNGVAVSPATLPHSISTTEWIAVGSSVTLIRLGDQSSSVAMDLAEVMWLPFQPTYYAPTWAAYLYNAGASRAAEDFPYLSMGGTWAATGADVVLGEVGQELLRDVGSAQYSSVEFTLRSSQLAR